jgi:hypothetical protein
MVSSYFFESRESFSSFVEAVVEEEEAEEEEEEEEEEAVVSSLETSWTT